MNGLALMKLMYLADREALIRFGRPITGDRVVAMKHGPVLSRVYDLLSHKKQELSLSEWEDFIPQPNSYVYTVKFTGKSESSELSQAEVALIDETFTKFRGMDEWALVDLTHKLPEWREPGDTTQPIPFEEILKAAKLPQEITEAIAHEAEADGSMEAALAIVGLFKCSLLAIPSWEADRSTAPTICGE